jgi:O-antigen/teichoic acid export membrane protein
MHPPLRTRIVSYFEQLFHADLRYVLGGGSWLVVGQAVTVLAGAMLAVALANGLSKESFGTYRFVLSIAATLSTFALPGMNVALSRAVARGFLGAYVGAFWSRTRWGLLGGACALVASAYYALHANTVLAIALGIAAVFLPFFDALSLYSAFWNGLRNFSWSAGSDAIVRVGSVACMVVTLALTQNPLYVIFAYFASTSLLRLFFFLIAWQQSRSGARTGDNADLASYSRHLSVIYVIGSVTANLDQIMLFHYAGAAAVAAYALATLAPDQVRAFVKNISTLAFPKYATQPFAAVQAQMFQRTVLVGAATAVLGGVYILAVPWVFPLFFPLYPEAMFLTQLMTLSLCDTLTLLPLAALKAHQMTAALYRYNIISGVFFMVCVTIGAICGGATGVVIGYITARAIGTAYAFVLFYTVATRDASVE